MNEHELHTLVSEAVKNNDIVEVRVNLVKCLFDKPAHNFRLFETEFKNAEKVLPNLVDEHDGEVFKSEEEWTKAYRNEQRHKLENNFSEKRIEFLKNVISTRRMKHKIRFAGIMTASALVVVLALVMILKH